MRSSATSFKERFPIRFVAATLPAARQYDNATYATQKGTSKLVTSERNQIEGAISSVERDDANGIVAIKATEAMVVV